MRIQIDTENKIIKIEESVNLGEFVDQLKKMLIDWQEYKIEKTVSYESIPYIPSIPYVPTSTPPWTVGDYWSLTTICYT